MLLLGDGRTTPEDRQNLKEGYNMKNQKQVQINPADAVEYLCPECNGSVFDEKRKIFRIPKLAMSNPTGADIVMATPIYRCSNPLCLHVLKEVTPR